MKIGFIVGKDDEFYDDDYLYDLTPKKYLANDGLQILRLLYLLKNHILM